MAKKVLVNSVVCHLHSVPGSAYSQSRMHFTEGRKKEPADDYDMRTWREHCHVNSDGHVIIPRDQFRLALADAAEYQAEKIKGRGNTTYTKHFGAGIQVLNDLVIKNGKGVPFTKETATHFRGPMHSTGKRNSGSRVLRTYPQFASWSGTVEFLVLDPVITEAVFEEHIHVAGMFIGVGRWRPRNRGQNGRFVCDKYEWKETGL